MVCRARVVLLKTSCNCENSCFVKFFNTNVSTFSGFPFAGWIPIRILIKSFVPRDWIIEFTPLWPADPLPLEIFTFPRGISISSCTITSFGALPRLGLGAPRPSLGNAPKLVIVHDDIDIPLGKVKISRGSGSAGHKGVNSIIQSLGTKDFIRIRIGIQPAKGKPENVETFVLKNFTKQEFSQLQEVFKSTTRALQTILNLST